MVDDIHPSIAAEWEAQRRRRAECRKNGHEEITDVEAAGTGGRSIRACTYCGETFGKVFG